MEVYMIKLKQYNKIFKRIFICSVMSLVAPMTIHAAKYNYELNNGRADNVRAGTHYTNVNGYVGCPDTIYGYPVNSIAKEGFIGFGSNDEKVRVPANATSIGQKAFYTIDSYTGKPVRYSGGAKLPARFWRYFQYIGLTPETPLENIGDNIFCDIDQRVPFIYNGKKQVPQNYMVYINNEPIGADPVIATDSIHAGTQKVLFRVRDITENSYNVSGTYYGSCTYEIEPYNIANASLKNGVKISYEYTGNPICPEPILDGGFGDIKNNSDFLMKYENNTNVGIAKMKACTGVNNDYTGEFTRTFVITPANIENGTITGFERKVNYQGNTTQSIHISMNGKELKKDVDYDEIYENNTNVGKAKLIIKGKNNYRGTIVKEFEITPQTIENFDVEYQNEFVFSAEKIMPVCKMNYNNMNLQENEDFTVKYINNENVGTGEIQIKGLNNYSGTIKKEFIIIPANIADTSMSGFSQIKNHTGRHVTQSIEFMYNNYSLVEGLDYKITYENNVNIGEAKMLVKGIGNFSGELTKKFAIIANALDDESTDVKLEDNYEFSDCESAIPLPDVIFNGETLVKDVDYTISYGDIIDLGNGKYKRVVTIIGKGKYRGTIEKEIFFTISENPDEYEKNKNQNNESEITSLNNSPDKNIKSSDLKSEENKTNVSNQTNITNITNKNTKKTSKYVKLKWKKKKKAKKYRVLLKQTYYTSKGKKVLRYKSLKTTTKTSYKKTGLSKNKTYYFKVQALNKKNKVIWSKVKKIKYKKNTTIIIK